MPTTVTRVRKRPIEHRALQYDGSNFDAVKEFLGDDYAGLRGNLDYGMALLVRTMEHPNEPFRALPGSWLLEGVKGEHWVVDHEVFELTYELLDADERLRRSEEDGAITRLLDAEAGRSE